MTLLNPMDQKVFVCPETTPGVAVFPSGSNAPSLSSVMAADYVNFTKNTSFTDSPEIRNSLNLKDQVKDKDTAGEWSFPILVRPSGFTGTGATKAVSPPMGDTLYKSLIGQSLYGKTGKLEAEIAADLGTYFTVYYLEDRPKGPLILRVGSELILVKYVSNVQVDITSPTHFQAVFHIDSRGYGGTTAAIGAKDTVVTIVSRTYSQEVNRDSFTLWFQRDTVTYFCAGATISNLSFTGENKGYPTFELSGGFMTMGWAGKSQLTSSASSGATNLIVSVEESKKYVIGSRVYNISLHDTNGLSGYEITNIDHSTGTITITDGSSGGISAAWTSGNWIGGYLPGVESIGSTLRSEDTVIKMGDSVADAVTPVSPTLTTKLPIAINFTFDSPIKYIEEEISPLPISKYTEERRSISGSLTQLMTNDELTKFYMSHYDVKQMIQFQLGTTQGSGCIIAMRRCTIQVPKESVSEPILEQSMDYTALDYDIEDSFVLSFI